MQIPIVDLHCDLLSYLAETPGRSANDPASRCSYPDLVKGGVHLQTLAIFTKTGPDSLASGQAQVEWFSRLPRTLQIIPAFENASGFADETEPFDTLIQRLENYLHTLGQIFYIGLTWNQENRFGGGNDSSVGLKEDGLRLLRYLSGKQIAIDLSHTSDPLAYDILNALDKEALQIPLIASHSNVRALSPYPRNLPDPLIDALIARKGLIGLNFFAPFVHDTDPKMLTRHVEYVLKRGGEKTLCFGADFFCDTGSLAALKQKYNREHLFYEELGNASVYPAVLRLLQDQLGLTQETLENIAFRNASAFLQKLK